MQKKRFVQLAAALSLAAIAQGAHAQANASSGNIRFEGEVKAVPCTLPGTSQNMTVTMGTYKTSDLNGAKGKLTTPTPFKIKLHCDPSVVAGKGATATFKGHVDAIENTALQVGAGQVSGSFADGVAVVVADSGGTTIPMNTESALYRLNGGDNELMFQASYISTKDAVTTGPANASAQFTITYK